MDSRIQMLTRLLAASEMRQEVIGSNLANANTPGFTRQEVVFEDLLNDAMRKGPAAIGRVEPMIVDDTTTPAGPDGNNVTLELELNAMRENRLLYESYASMLQGHFSLMSAAVQGGN